MCSPMLLMNPNHGIFGLNMLNFFGSTEEDKVLKYLKEGIELAGKGKITTLISGRYKLEDAEKALKEIVSGKTTGKLILECQKDYN